ncbi:Acyl-CoA synthetase family member 2, mitochondrial, partial [Trichinella britovi]
LLILFVDAVGVRIASDNLLQRFETEYFSDKQKSVENMVMSNERNETQVGSSMESDSHGCFDFIEQKIVPFGEYYMTDNCLFCMCNKTERFCKQIGCSPIKCDGIVHKDPRNCCDVCTPSVILGTPVEHASASLKLGGMTITFLIIVSTVFFMLHRLRRKRLLITVRRCHSGDGNFQPFRESFDRSCVACPNAPPPPPPRRSPRTVFDRRPNAAGAVNYNDPPPPYSATVAQPPPLLTTSAIARMPHYFNGPPPPYPCSSGRQQPAAEPSVVHLHRCPAHRNNGAGRRSLPEIFSPTQWSNSRKPSDEEVGGVGELQAASNCCSSSSNASALHNIRDDASSIASTGTTTTTSSDCSNSTTSSGGNGSSTSCCSTECECQHYLKDDHSSVPNSTQNENSNLKQLGIFNSPTEDAKKIIRIYIYNISVLVCLFILVVVIVVIVCLFIYFLEMSGDRWNSEQQSLAEALEVNCVAHADREAMVFVEEGKRWTFGQLSQAVCKLAKGFLSVGLKPSDRILLVGFNCSDLAVSVFAASRAGLVFTLASPMLLKDYFSLHELINTIQCKAVVFYMTEKSEKYFSNLAQLIPKLLSSSDESGGCLLSPSLTHVFVAGPGQTNFKAAYSLSEVWNSVNEVVEVQCKPGADDLAAILLTSKVHGKPKAVQLTHYQLLKSCLIVGSELGLTDPAEIVCCVFPIFRGPAMCIALLSNALFGSKVVYPAEQPLPADVWRAIESEGCTCILTSPTALSLMLRLSDLNKYNLTTLISGEDSCFASDQFSQELLSLLKKTNIKMVMSGMFLTEAGCMPIFFPKMAPCQKMTISVGKAHGNFEIKIVDQQGNRCRPGETGELCVHTLAGSKFLGYVVGGEENSCLKEENWIHTEDLATVDKDGYVSLWGKTSDVINRKGTLLYPHMYERHIGTLQWIQSVQAIELPDAENGENFCICILLKPKVEVNKDMVINKIRSNCSEAKLPPIDHILIMDEFPRTIAKRVKNRQDRIEKNRKIDDLIDTQDKYGSSIQIKQTAECS